MLAIQPTDYEMIMAIVSNQERVPRLLSLVEIEYEKTRGLWILLPDALPGCLASMIAAWPLTAQ